MQTRIDLGELIETNPFPDMVFKSMEEVKDKPMTIIATVPFENDKGKGVHLAGDLNGVEVRLCTHAVAIVNTFANKRVMDALNEGAGIDVVFYEGTSQTTGRRMWKVKGCARTQYRTSTGFSIDSQIRRFHERNWSKHRPEDGVMTLHTRFL